MSAMGDGLPFTPWIEQLISRKSGLGRDDYLAQSHAGVHACLAGGVTTIADCSYADTVAEAAIAQGLRAIVYLEAFSEQDDPAALMAARLDALPEHPLITPGISPHAPYTVTPEHYAELIGLARARGIPVATHLLESERDTRPLSELAELLGPDTVGHPSRPCRRGRTRAAGRAGRAGRALPALERAARLRHGAAAGDAGGRDHGRARHRLAGLGADLRHVGRDAGGDPAGAGARAAAGRAERGTGAARWRPSTPPARSAWASGSAR